MKKYEQFMFNTILTICAIMMLITLTALCETIKYKRYDVNRDGVVSAADYVAVKNYIMEEH